MAYISVPNTLVGGQTIIAADLNTNFTTITTGLSDGAKDIAVSTVSVGVGSLATCSVQLGATNTGLSVVTGAIKIGISGTAYLSISTTKVDVTTALIVGTATLSTTSFPNQFNVTSTTATALTVFQHSTDSASPCFLAITSATTGTGDLLAAYNNGGATRLFQVSNIGNVTVGSAALATTATDGFLYIPSCAGAPTGVPTSSTGRVPMVFDSTNNKFYIYDGGWLGVTLS